MNRIECFTTHYRTVSGTIGGNFGGLPHFGTDIAYSLIELWTVVSVHVNHLNRELLKRLPEKATSELIMKG